MFRLVSLEKDNKYKKLVTQHLGSNYPIKDGILLKKDNKIVGYALYKTLPKNKIMLDWIWAPGYGVYLFKKLENKWKKTYTSIVLKVSLDPNEQKMAVIRRLNFWYKMKFQTKNVKYRPKYGPLLTMEKKF